MKTRLGIGGGLAALLLMVSSVGLKAQESYRLTGSQVAVYNVAGNVEIVAGSGSDVVVEVELLGADARELEVATGEIGGKETLRIIYPDDRILYGKRGRGGRTQFRVRDDGTFGDRGGRGGREIEVTGRGRGLEAHADLRIEVPNGQRFEMYLGVGETTVENVDGELRVDTHSGSVVTRNTSGTLIVDTGSGSVKVNGASGEVVVDTGSGSVEVNDIDGPRLYVDTGSGSVRGSGIAVGILEVDTGSGGIELDRVESSDVVLDTGSGSVEVDLMVDVERLSVDTGSGSVTVYLAEETGAEIEVDTGSGGIDVDMPVQVRTVRRTYLSGVLGDGRGDIMIDTGSGSVRLLTHGSR